MFIMNKKLEKTLLDLIRRFSDSNRLSKRVLEIIEPLQDMMAENRQRIVKLEKLNIEKENANSSST